MNQDRLRKISLLALLVLAVAAFAYIAVVRRQPRHEMAAGQAANQKDVYYCPMHKTYHSDKPGNCPICGMKLVKLETSSAAATPDASSKSAPSAAGPASAPTASSASQENAIFVPPEKQQLI